MKPILIAAAALGLAACASEDRTGRQAQNAWALDTATAMAPPTDCIERTRIRGEAPRDDRTIDFVLDDGRTFRNRLPMACSGLVRAQRFIHRTGLDRLCSTDTIAILSEEGRPAGTCGLGRFQEVSIPPRQTTLR